jgi:hypothetical protein
MRSKRQLSDPITRGSLVARQSGPTRADCLLYITQPGCRDLGVNLEMQPEGDGRSRLALHAVLRDVQA